MLCSLRHNTGFFFSSFEINTVLQMWFVSVNKFNNRADTTRPFTLRQKQNIGSRFFSLFHARDKTKNIFLNLFTELKTYYLSYSLFFNFFTVPIFFSSRFIFKEAVTTFFFRIFHLANYASIMTSRQICDVSALHWLEFLIYIHQLL